MSVNVIIQVINYVSEMQANESVTENGSLALSALYYRTLPSSGWMSQWSSGLLASYLPKHLAHSISVVQFKWIS